MLSFAQLPHARVELTVVHIMSCKMPLQRYLLRAYSSHHGGQFGSTKKKGWFIWIGIPISFSLSCLAFFYLTRTLRREQRFQYSRELDTWQLTLFRQLPARALSRMWGNITAKELPRWCRRPVLGLYVSLFGCNMEEAIIEDIKEYSSLLKLFTRRLKENARTVSVEHSLVSPCDGKVLHFGVVDPSGYIEQVKDVTYQVDKFLGPISKTLNSSTNRECESNNCLYYIIIYLSPGDYHHFHSPTDWTVKSLRHFPGELLTVAPWAAKKMPGLFALNERTVLLGNWTHGFFSYTAVGAFNVGSIQLTVDEDLKTNTKGRYKIGEFTEKQYQNPVGLTVAKGDRLGCFNLGSSIVLVFEAPKDFQFQVHPHDRVYFGQPL